MGVMFFQNGVALGSDAGWGGFTGNNNYVVRYDFTTGAEGASQLAIVLNNIWYGHGAGKESFGFRVSETPNEFCALRNAAPQSNTAVMQYSASTGYGCTLWAQGLNIPPYTRCYIFVYVVTGGAEYYTGWNCVSPQIVTGGVYIPPCSSISSVSSSVTTGENVSILMNRAGTNRHRAEFRCGDTLLAVSEPFTSALSYTCPRTWLTQDITAQSLTVSVSVQCYADAACLSPVGDALPAEFLLTADRDMRPQLTSQAITVSAVNTNTEMSQFVAGLSKARVCFDRTEIDMTNCAGAQICAFTVNGLSSPENEILTGVLTAETVLVCSVRDTRGFESSVKVTVSPLSYVPPSLSDIAAMRCNADGSGNAQGTYYKVKGTAVSTIIGGNTVTVKAALRRGSGNWENEQVLSGFESGVWSDEWEQPLILGGNLSGDSFTVRLKITDAMGGESVYILPLYNSQWAMKFNADGSAVGFGMAPTLTNAMQLPEHWRLCGAIPVLSGRCYGTAAPETAVTSPIEGQIYLKITE